MRILTTEDSLFANIYYKGYSSGNDEVILKLKAQLNRAMVLRQKMAVRDLTKQIEIQMAWRESLHYMIY